MEELRAVLVELNKAVNALEDRTGSAPDSEKISEVTALLGIAVELLKAHP